MGLSIDRGGQMINADDFSSVVQENQFDVDFASIHNN